MLETPFVTHGRLPAPTDTSRAWANLVGTTYDDDPALALVTADMDAWSDAHPCECAGLCTCEEAGE